MSWIIAILVGALIGWIASMIMKSNHGFIVDAIIGIVGSILGKWIFADLLGIGGAAAAGSFSIAGLAFGVLGAVILIFLLRLLKIGA